MEPTSRPAGGLRGDDELDVSAKLPGDDDLLLVAARQVAHLDIDTRRPNVVLLDQPFRGFSGFVPVHDDAPRKRRCVVAVEHHVLRHREFENETAALAIFWNVGDALAVNLARRGVRDVIGGQPDGARQRLAQSRQGFDEFGLPVALDAGHPDDLAGSNLEADIVESSMVSLIHNDQV